MRRKRADGYCSVWKDIKRRDKRAIDDITDAVKRKLRQRTRIRRVAGFETKPVRLDRVLVGLDVQIDLVQQQGAADAVVDDRDPR